MMKGTMKIVIMKFGGTSLDTQSKRELVVKQVKASINKGITPVLVVSAIGRKGSPYATDTLLQFAEQSGSTLSPVNYDLLLSCGEIISSVVLAQEFYKQGISATCLSGGEAGIITNDKFGEASIIKINPINIIKVLDEKAIPIITGFQGFTADGIVTTLGRGGSDTTACGIGAALKAERIEIYTDVSGMLSGDPKVIDSPDFLQNISYEEAAEFAAKGASVIHPRAVELAKAKQIPINILSLDNCYKSTTIHNVKHDRPVTGVTIKENIFFVSIERNNYSFDIFRKMADAGLSLDFINITRSAVSFILNDNKTVQTEKILHDMGCKFEIRHRFVKVSVVGSGMQGISGVMAKIVDCLTSNEIDVENATDSHNTISCLIKLKDGNRAVKLLHQKFINWQ